MERLERTFRRLRSQRRKALIPFIMGGDPSLSLTGPLLLALQTAGADLIEVGIPFSDPLADGPVIQAASARALARGATPSRVLAAIASVRAQLSVPVVCLSYWNLVIQFGHGQRGPTHLGPEPFLQAIAASGVSGLIVPDLPIEEGQRLHRAAAAAGVATIFLAAPTSPPERLRHIARASHGFIYYVSVTGTTGARRTLPHGLVQGLRQLRLITTKPLCVGFGISTPAQAATIAHTADGVIVGSALIHAIDGARRGTDTLRNASRFLRSLRRTL